ncbi:7177_t:CDS:2, partial [Funneliformis mosseae]
NEHVSIDLQIPPAFYGFIIGRKGSKINHLKQETKTIITVLSDKELVNIRGYERNVNMAKIKIYNIIENTKFLLPPTHFISLPLSDSNTQRKVKDFQNEVLQLKLANIDKSILIKPPSLHLTIGMLNLYLKEDIKEAVDLLKKLSQEINDLIGKRTIVSNLTGIEIMDDNKGMLKQ